MKNSTRFVGLDDSKDFIEVAVAESDRDGEVRQFGSISNTPASLRKLVRRLGRSKGLHFVYEAGPGGYGIYRELRALGADCIVAAPTKTPRRTGDRWLAAHWRGCCAGYCRSIDCWRLPGGVCR